MWDRSATFVDVDGRARRSVAMAYETDECRSDAVTRGVRGSAAWRSRLPGRAPKAGQRRREGRRGRRNRSPPGCAAAPRCRGFGRRRPPGPRDRPRKSRAARGRLADEVGGRARAVLAHRRAAGGESTSPQWVVSFVGVSVTKFGVPTRDHLWSFPIGPSSFLQRRPAGGAGPRFLRRTTLNTVIVGSTAVARVLGWAGTKQWILVSHPMLLASRRGV